MLASGPGESICMGATSESAGAAESVRNDPPVADAWRLRAPTTAERPGRISGRLPVSVPRGLTGVVPVRGIAPIDKEVTPPRRLAGGVLAGAGSSAAVDAVASSILICTLSGGFAMASTREEKSSSSNADRFRQPAALPCTDGKILFKLQLKPRKSDTTAINSSMIRGCNQSWRRPRILPNGSD